MATVFSTKEPNPGAWFKFNDEDPGSGEIRIRAVNQAKRTEIQKKCVKPKTEYKNGQRFEFTDTNDTKFSEMLWDYTIVEWKNLEDDDGTPLVCDTETKMKLMLENVGFSQFVSNCLSILNDLEEERVAKVTANLSKEQSVSKKSRPALPAKN
jgi:hypothetical protein